MEPGEGRGTASDSEKCMEAGNGMPGSTGAMCELTICLTAASWDRSSPVTEMTPPFTYTVRVLGPPVGSNRPQSHMRDPAKEMGVRRRQLYANRGESLQGSEERVFWVGSQQRQDHGCKPGAEGGWE